MAVSSRYFLLQNPFMHDLLYANAPQLGGDENVLNDNLYIKIPFLLIGKYNHTYVSHELPSINGAMFYIKQFDKIYIELSNSFTGIQPRALTNFNGRAVYYYDVDDDYVFYWHGRKKQSENEIEEGWIESFFPVSSHNMCYLSTEEWNGENKNNWNYSTNRISYNAMLSIDGTPQYGEYYRGGTRYIAYDGKDNDTGSRVFSFTVDGSGFYTRADDAIDITPQEKREISEDIAGKWVNSSNKIIYIGMPIFEYKNDSDSFKFIPRAEDFSDQEIITYKSDIDESVENKIYRRTRTMMTGYDNDYKFILYYDTNYVWNGSSSVRSVVYYYRLGFEQKDQNGGYWQSENYTDYISNIEEEVNAPVLKWVSTDGETQNGDLSCFYIGSSIEKNLIYRYNGRKLQTDYRQFVIKTLNRNYHYSTEEESE